MSCLRPSDVVACWLGGARRRIATIHYGTWSDLADVTERQARWRRATWVFHAVTAPSSAAAAAQLVAGVDPDRIHVVPNPIRLDAGSGSGLRPVTRSHRPEFPAHVLLFAGRLEPEKGLLDLIQAFGSVANRLPDWRLLIAGSGSLEPALPMAIVSAGLEGRAEVLGFVDDVRPLLAFADLAALPSYVESFGMSVAEAMSVGCAVIATPVGVVPDLEPGAVELVAAGDVGALAAAIERVGANDGIRAEVARRGRRAADRFEADRVAAQYEALYGCHL